MRVLLFLLDNIHEFLVLLLDLGVLVDGDEVLLCDHLLFQLVHRGRHTRLSHLYLPLVTVSVPLLQLHPRYLEFLDIMQPYMHTLHIVHLGQPVL